MVKAEFKTILLASVLLPVAFGLFFGTNTSAWDATTILVWSIFPVIAIVVVLMRMAGKI